MAHRIEHLNPLCYIKLLCTSRKLHSVSKVGHPHERIKNHERIGHNDNKKEVKSPVHIMHLLAQRIYYSFRTIIISPITSYGKANPTANRFINSSDSKNHRAVSSPLL